jgi:L-alanine-DL-glutamate epimerase-like enolase superfamily enzyme
MEDEVERVAAVREAIGHAVQLRLDANGAWDVDRAIATIGALRGLDLELIEQPVPGHDVEGLARVRHAVGVPIAADEAVTSVAQARRILGAGAADVLVVKPMVLGGLGPARQLIQQAREAGRDVIVTTTVDTGVGVAAALHLAATLPRPTRACGLATGPLLVGDLIGDRLAVEGGTMSISPRPGLGVEVDPEQVLRFGTGIHGETEG